MSDDVIGSAIGDSPTFDPPRGRVSDAYAAPDRSDDWASWANSPYAAPENAVAAEIDAAWAEYGAHRGQSDADGRAR